MNPLLSITLFLVGGGLVGLMGLRLAECLNSSRPIDVLVLCQLIYTFIVFSIV